MLEIRKVWHFSAAESNFIKSQALKGNSQAVDERGKERQGVQGGFAY